MRIAEQWTYHGSDPCVRFFGHLLRRANPDIPPDARVLEIGCCEFDWLTEAHNCWPEMDLTGIDPRASHVYAELVRTHPWDARDVNLFAANRFDLIVSISTIEHIGLGHYGDPIDLQGDIVAVANACRWLKPGGWLLFDVPYTPERFDVLGTKCRVYDDEALIFRLGVDPREACYAHANDTHTVIDTPTVATDPFYYVGCAWQKPA